MIFLVPEYLNAWIPEYLNNYTIITNSTAFIPNKCQRGIFYPSAGFFRDFWVNPAGNTASAVWNLPTSSKHDGLGKIIINRRNNRVGVTYWDRVTAKWEGENVAQWEMRRKEWFGSHRLTGQPRMMRICPLLLVEVLGGASLSRYWTREEVSYPTSLLLLVLLPLLPCPQRWWVRCDTCSSRRYHHLLLPLWVTSTCSKARSRPHLWLLLQGSGSWRPYLHPKANPLQRPPKKRRSRPRTRWRGRLRPKLVRKSKSWCCKREASSSGFLYGTGRNSWSKETSLTSGKSPARWMLLDLLDLQTGR